MVISPFRRGFPRFDETPRPLRPPDPGVGHHRRSSQQRHIRGRFVRPDAAPVGHVPDNVQQSRGRLVGDRGSDHQEAPEHKKRQPAKVHDQDAGQRRRFLDRLHTSSRLPPGGRADRPRRQLEQ